MATGDITWFRQGLLDLGKKVHDLSADTLKLGIIDATQTPDPTDADPRFGAGGTTNYATDEVAAGSSYSAGGPALSSVSWALQSNQPELRAAQVTIAQDPTGFNDGRWGIVYNATAANRALLMIDLGAARSVQGGPLVFDWNSVNDILARISGA